MQIQRGMHVCGWGGRGYTYKKVSSCSHFVYCVEVCKKGGGGAKLPKPPSPSPFNLSIGTDTYASKYPGIVFLLNMKKKFHSRRTDAVLRHLSQIFMSRELSFFIWMERKWNLTYCARGIKKIKNNLFKQVYTPNFTGKKNRLKNVADCWWYQI